ncbi:Ig-like domain-containing protein [Enterococcus villorum]|uniref:Ig-like domain-containing protein n=1 Tax=Enterococcus villorum TaxID=112904 RepID=UPI003F896ABC
MFLKVARLFTVFFFLFPFFGSIRNASAEVDIGPNLITNVSILNNQNEPVTTIKKDESFKLDLQWSLENIDDLKAGDKATITLPIEIEGINNTYEIYDENNQLVANVTQVGNTLTFVFTDFVEQNENIHGDFYFWSKFSENVQENQTNNIRFETANGIQTIPIFIQPGDDNNTGEGALITKKGLYLGTQNPKRVIDWRIYINSYDTNKVTITDGKLIDTLGAHQTLISTSARVVYGESVSNPSFVEQVPISLNSDGSFEIPLRETNERIYITYKTQTDGSLEQYTNKATLQGLINGVSTTRTVTGYTTKYGGGGSGTGDPTGSGSSSESTTEPSSETSSESTTESSSDTSSESTTESSSETSSESTTESSSDTSSESTTESSNETSSESTTEPSNETSSESTTEPSNETSSESTTEPSSETSSESTTESSSETSSESTTDPSSDTSSEGTTEPSNETSSESTIESSSETSSESTTESSSETNNESTVEPSRELIVENAPTFSDSSNRNGSRGQKNDMRGNETSRHNVLSKIFPRTNNQSNKYALILGFLLILFFIYRVSRLIKNNKK